MFLCLQHMQQVLSGRMHLNAIILQPKFPFDVLFPQFSALFILSANALTFVYIYLKVAFINKPGQVFVLRSVPRICRPPPVTCYIRPKLWHSLLSLDQSEVYNYTMRSHFQLGFITSNSEQIHWISYLLSRQLIRSEDI